MTNIIKMYILWFVLNTTEPKISDLKVHYL